MFWQDHIDVVAARCPFSLSTIQLYWQKYWCGQRSNQIKGLIQLKNNPVKLKQNVPHLLAFLTPNKARSQILYVPMES